MRAPYAAYQSFLNALSEELESLEVNPRSLAGALAEFARLHEVREAVAKSNAEADKRNAALLSAGCPKCHGRLNDDGHGGICPVCDEY